ncbi:hypothetical protein M0R19_02840 [Candidatus Pacearchaeota archaeon]|nr:hypothetical protein [Candidatus Pacearchaeota archaeon]
MKKLTHKFYSILEGTHSYPPNLMMVSKEGLGIIAKGDYREVGEVDYALVKEKLGCSLFVEGGVPLHCLGKAMTITSRELLEIEKTNDSEKIIEVGYTNAKLYVGKITYYRKNKRKFISNAYLISDKDELSFRKEYRGYSLLLNGRFLPREELRFRGDIEYFLRNDILGIFTLEKIANLYNVQKRTIMPCDRTSKIFC